MAEGSLFFEDKGSVQKALRKIASRLTELGIPYAIVGGMAAYHHGYRRFTEDVDLLVTRPGLKLIHEKLDGLGYLPPFLKSKNLRDVELGVKIEFLITGDYPGDGKPKPVAFPDPVSASDEVDGIRYLNLCSLIELKLASGMTAVGRLRDLSDVVELIKVLVLPLDYGDRLNPYVQEKYRELWPTARRRYMRLRRNHFPVVDGESPDERIERLRSAEQELEAMKRDGVVLEPEGAAGDNYARLITTDLKIARKYGMEDESEFWEDEGDDIEPVAS